MGRGGGGYIKGQAGCELNASAVSTPAILHVSVLWYMEVTTRDLRDQSHLKRARKNRESLSLMGPGLNQDPGLAHVAPMLGGAHGGGGGGFGAACVLLASRRWSRLTTHTYIWTLKSSPKAQISKHTQALQGRSSGLAQSLKPGA